PGDWAEPDRRALSASEIWRPAEALARASRSEAVLAEIVEAFLADVPGLVEEMRAAVAANDATRIERAAHRLKGSASFFGADAVVAAAQRLEAIGKSGRLAEAGQEASVL